MFSQNLVRLRKARGYTQDFVAQYLDIKRQTYSAYERSISVPDIMTLNKLSDLFEISSDELLGREALEHSGVKVPVLPKIQAGIPLNAVPEVIDYEEITDDMAQQGEFFALQIRGDSMNPRMADGDIVIVRSQQDVESGQIGVVIVGPNDAVIKKVVKHQGGGLSLIPFNPTYAPKFYTNHEVDTLPIRIIGKVVELRAKF